VIQRMIATIDRFQRRRAWAAFPLAVFKKFGEDRGGNLAALVAYYGFFSLFPLLLVFVSVLGMVLQGNRELRQRLVDSALGQFPVIGDQLQVGTLRGSGLALGVGLVTAVWTGLRVTQSFQQAMDDVWDVPLRDRPSFVGKRLRGLLVLALLGTFAVAATAVSAFDTARGAGPGARALGHLLSLALNLGLFVLAFRILTTHPVRWGDVLPGGAAAAVLWTVLQSVGSLLVGRHVAGAQDVYGTFALVIGMLFWIYLGAQIAILCAEVNVVRARRLWPRSLVEPPVDDPGAGWDSASPRQRNVRKERQPQS